MSRGLLRSDGVFQRFQDGPMIDLESLAPDEFTVAFPHLWGWAIYRDFDFMSENAATAVQGWHPNHRRQLT